MNDTDQRDARAHEVGLEAGVARSRGGFMSRLRGFFGGSSFGDADWDAAEEALIAGDVGVVLAGRVVEAARSRRDSPSPAAAVRSELEAILAPRDPDWDLRPAVPGHPTIVLVVGVNGTGKTTTIGKLATREGKAGRRVILAAADTFRAAASEQLGIWAKRAGADMVAHAPGADPAAVVYDAIDAGVARGADIVIADTAGRLHTKVNLMDELAKIRRVIDRRLPGAKPETLFVLDATTGQNGLSQADRVPRGGRPDRDRPDQARLDIAGRHRLRDRGSALGVPVRFVGVGEGPNDLLAFDPPAFVAALYGPPDA